MIKIIIDPRFKINYASYYIYGIKELVGYGKLSFRPIAGINIETDRECRIGFALKVITDDSEKNIYIDYGDWNMVYEKYYKWADVYAKINVRKDDLTLKKLLVIGPSFGIKLWNPIKCFFQGFKNYLLIKRSDNNFERPFSQYIKDYGYMFLRRRDFKYYFRFTQEEEKGYFFSFNTLWYGDLSHNTTNKLRGEFMRECQKLMETFDGGFYYIDSQVVLDEFPKYVLYLKEYEDLIAKRRLSMDEYDKRTRKSWFVFNTPSVGGCHGWKLAEFLCEGKAIISTAFHNEMPKDFIDGVHYLKVETREEMAEAIIKLREDEFLLNQLKQNAFQYFNDNLMPIIVIQRIFNRIGLQI